MAEKSQTAAIPPPIRTKPAPRMVSPIVVRQTPDGKFWATTKGYLGIGTTEAEAVEKLTLIVETAGCVIPEKSDTASRPVTAAPRPPTE
jgi:hypothetical protein